MNNLVKTKDYLRAVRSCFARIEPTKRRSLVIAPRGYHTRQGDQETVAAAAAAVVGE